MPASGYPDYTRLTRSGGIELGAATGNITNLQQIFKGYVGNFSYVALTTNVDVSADFASVDLIWYSDSTFTTSVGLRRCLRTGSQFAETQYVNLSDWLLVQVETKSGAAMPFIWISAYGCQSAGDQYALTSNDVPLLGQTSSIAAATTISVTPQHVTPGSAFFTLQTVAASWFVNVNYYNWNTGAYTLLRQYNSTTYIVNIGERLSCLDTPYRFDVHNGDAAAKSFVLGWFPD
jgi:hypothetical protein